MSENENNKKNLKMSRRTTLITAFTGGLLSSLGVNSVGAQRPPITKGGPIEGNRVGVNIAEAQSLNDSDNADIYRQIKIDESGEMSSGIDFHLDDEFEITLSGVDGFSGIVTVDIDAQINQNVNEDEFGEENTDDEELFQARWDTLTMVEDEVSGPEIEFNLVDGGDFDISDNIDDGEIKDGKLQLTSHEELSDEEPKNRELGVDLPTDRANQDGVPRNRSQIEIRLRMYSNDGSIDEEITVVLILDVTPELGLGRLLGYNLGKDHIPEWDRDDWEAQKN